MSPYPTRMRDRWKDRAEAQPGRGTIYWHVLMREYPNVLTAANLAQERLATFSGFHMTPHDWLHMTVLIAGSTDEISPDQMNAMVSTAQRMLSSIKPVRIAFGRILYHPEAIMLGAEPSVALKPMLEAAQKATQMQTGSSGQLNGSLPTWTPHVTVAYSVTEQPAAPIIEAMGKSIPTCEVEIQSMSLVIQWGPERLWNWQPVGTVRLNGNGCPPVAS